MDYHGAKHAVNRFLLRYAGWDQRPVFFDIDAVCPALRGLERAYPWIRAEADALLQQRVAMPRYHEVNPPAREMRAHRRSADDPGGRAGIRVEGRRRRAVR